MNIPQYTKKVAYKKYANKKLVHNFQNINQGNPSLQSGTLSNMPKTDFL